jgi:uncharacterized integral membrane protein
VKHLCTRFGLNYLFGLANFTLGVTLGGIVVAGVLIGAMPLRSGLISTTPISLVVALIARGAW